ncbi:MAG: hypothetical protein ACYDDA_10380 [Acidiferrobacteraceae bacterium]
MSRASILSVVFTLAKHAENRGLKFLGSALIARIAASVPFKNGAEAQKGNAHDVAASVCNM